MKTSYEVALETTGVGVAAGGIWGARQVALVASAAHENGLITEADVAAVALFGLGAYCAKRLIDRFRTPTEEQPASVGTDPGQEETAALTSQPGNMVEADQDLH